MTRFGVFAFDLALSACMLLYTACFSAVAGDVSGLSMEFRMRCASYIILGLFLLYHLFYLGLWCVGYAMGCHKYSTTDAVYSDAEELPQRFGRPVLSMSSIWSLVYGLGFFLYVTSYVLGCACSTLTGHAYVFGLCGVVVGDVAAESSAMRSLGTAGVLVVVLVAEIVLVCTLGNFVVQVPEDVFSMVAVFVLPCVSSIVIVAVKECHEYYVRDMLDFGLPFMFILALGFVGVSESPGVTLARGKAFLSNVTFVPSTSEQAIFQANHIGAMIFAPVALMGCLYLIVSRIMKGQTIDVLLSFVLMMLVGSRSDGLQWDGRIGAVCLLWCVGMAGRVWMAGLPRREPRAPPPVDQDGLGDLESPRGEAGKVFTKEYRSGIGSYLIDTTTNEKKLYVMQGSDLNPSDTLGATTVKLAELNRYTDPDLASAAFKKIYDWAASDGPETSTRSVAVERQISQKCKLVARRAEHELVDPVECVDSEFVDSVKRIDRELACSEGRRARFAGRECVSALAGAHSRKLVEKSVTQAFVQHINQLTDGSKGLGERVKQLKSWRKKQGEERVSYIAGITIYGSDVRSLNKNKSVYDSIVQAGVAYGVNSVAETMRSGSSADVWVMDLQVFHKLFSLSPGEKPAYGVRSLSLEKRARVTKVLCPVRVYDLEHFVLAAADLESRTYEVVDSIGGGHPYAERIANVFHQALSTGFNDELQRFKGEWTYVGCQVPRNQAFDKGTNNCGFHTIVNAVYKCVGCTQVTEDVDLIREKFFELLTVFPAYESPSELERLMKLPDGVVDHFMEDDVRNSAMCLALNEFIGTKLENHKRVVDKLGTLFRTAVLPNRIPPEYGFPMLNGVPPGVDFKILPIPFLSNFNPFDKKNDLSQILSKGAGELPPYVSFLLGDLCISPNDSASSVNLLHLLQMDDSAMESHHSWVQTWFPNFNGTGIMKGREYMKLPRDFYLYLHSHPWFYYMVCAMVHRYLKFVGIRFRTDEILSMCLVDRDLFREKLGTGGHNVKRFSRMLMFLCAVGLHSMALSIINVVRTPECRALIRDPDLQIIMWVSHANHGLDAAWGSNFSFD